MTRTLKTSARAKSQHSLVVVAARRPVLRVPEALLLLFTLLRYHPKISPYS